MNRGRAVAVAVTAGLAGVLASACSSSGPSVPPLNDAVWDGDRFVVHNQAYDDASTIWTSLDGVIWEPSEDFVMAALPFACHPDHPCDLGPNEVETVPFHFAEPWSRAVAGHGDTVIHEVGINYNVSRELASTGTQFQLHPQFLALAERTSACFADLAAEIGPDVPEPTPNRAFVEVWDWSPERFSATCTDADGSDRFAVEFSDVLSQEQRRLIEGGAPRQLVVTSDSGVETLVPDPPTSVWLDGEPDQRPSISTVVASSDRFWSVDDGVLVSSVDGLVWDPVAIGPDGWSVDQVVATPGGDVAVALRSQKTATADQASHLVISHDDGATWGRTVETPTPFWQVVDVGPSAAAVLGVGSDELIVIDSTSGAPVLIIDDRIPGLLTDVGIGAQTLIVPQVVSGPDGIDEGHFEIYDLTGQLMGTSG